MPATLQRPPIPYLPLPDDPAVTVDARHGTPLWALDTYRKAVLHALIADLHRLGPKKFGPDHEVVCGRVREALERAIAQDFGLAVKHCGMQHRVPIIIFLCR